MSSSSSSSPHIALLPSAGMGHLTPFLRLAVALADRGCLVSLITPQPTVSASESYHIAQFFTSFPHINSLDLHLPPVPSDNAQDPFFLRFEAIRQSCDRILPPLLTSVTAIVTDISLLSATLPVAKAMPMPCYTLFTSSAAMLAFCASFNQRTWDDTDVPGIGKIPPKWIPLPLRNPEHLFTTQFVANGRSLTQCDGILINTVDALEADALVALNSGKVNPGLPMVFSIGPLQPLPSPVSLSSPIQWLDGLPESSVLYVSFGSRTAMPAKQIKELAEGLEMSGCRFLWVLKVTVVDREDDESVLDGLLGPEYKNRVKNRGLVAHKWVEQERVLQHPAIGAFLSHCGWNSVTEAATFGRMILAWPRIGDQRINAGVVKSSGLGEWEEQWSWEGEEEVVKAEEIARKVKEVMGNEALKASADKIGRAASAAIGAGGSSDGEFRKFVELLAGIV